MGGGKEEGRRKERGRREGDATLNSLGSGWFRFREWFVFALGWMDGLLEALVWFVWLVWSGLAGLAGCILPVGGTSGVTTRSVLSVWSFVSCCMLYAVYSIQYLFCLVFALLMLTCYWRH